MEIPHCFEDTSVVEPFMKKARESLPFITFYAIHSAYVDQDKMFKSVALTHLKNHFKKASMSKDDLKELVNLLDTFRDPYQDFLEKGRFRTWSDIKFNILGGIIS